MNTTMLSNKKTVCIDARMIFHSGIGVYIKNFTKVVLQSQKYKINLLGKTAVLSNIFGSIDINYIEADFPIYSIEEQIKLPLKIRNSDVFWSPHYNSPIFPIRASKRLLTIPDVYHLAFYDTLSLSQKVYAKLILSFSVFNADHVVTISDYSRDQIMKFLDIRSEKLTTIPLGLDREFFSAVTDKSRLDKVKETYSLPDKYILFVGNVKPNKNLRALIGAFKLLMEKISDLFIVIVGKQDGFINGDPDLFNFINSDQKLASKIVFTGYAALEDLPAIYTLASVFAFPSLYEGFGFPPLEAMACGTPVVASDRASIPEICGDAAFYCDPTDHQSFSNALYDVYSNENLRKILIDKGLAQVKKYDWKKAGKEFLDVLDSLLLKA